MAPRDAIQYEASDTQRSHGITSPFVAFKRFADEQLSSLMNQTFGTNPFLLSPAVSYQQFEEDYERWLTEARNEQSRRTQAFIRRSGPLNSCPYREPATGDLSESQTRDLDSFLRSTAQGKAAERSERSHDARETVAFPLSYILISPYSPINLETEHPELAGGSIALRAAFEDLLRAHNGLPLSQDPLEHSHTTEGPSQWASNMVNLLLKPRTESFTSQHTSNESFDTRASCPYISAGARRDVPDDGQSEDDSVGTILSQAMTALVSPDQWSRLIDLASSDNLGQTDPHRDHHREMDEDVDFMQGEIAHDPNKDGVELEPVTELDLMQRFLGVQKTPPSSKILEALAQRGRKGHDLSSEEPTILSTLETTHKTMLPDGSVSTKVTLQKKFADGREESVETHHRQSPTAEPARQHGRPKPTEGRRGWFWS